jgi:hypothetical protein
MPQRNSGFIVYIPGILILLFGVYFIQILPVNNPRIARDKRVGQIVDNPITELRRGRLKANNGGNIIRRNFSLNVCGYEFYGVFVRNALSISSVTQAKREYHTYNKQDFMFHCFSGYRKYYPFPRSLFRWAVKTTPKASKTAAVIAATL